MVNVPAAGALYGWMSTFEHKPSDGEPGAPAGLEEALRALYGRSPEVPGEIDRAVLAGARRGPVLRWRGLGAGLAAAAALGVAVSAWVLSPRARQGAGPAVGSSSPSAGLGVVAEDLDGDGRVDIVDALRLARAVERGETGAWDFNGDGAVDRGDVDALAARAVRLPGGGGA